MAQRRKGIRRCFACVIFAMIPIMGPAFASGLRLGRAGELNNQDVGGKASVLHKILRTCPKLPAMIPDSFVIPTSVLRDVLGANMRLLEDALDNGTDIEVQLEQVKMFLSDVRLPGGLMVDLENFVADHPQSNFAVRSSAVMEDSMASACAGLFNSELKVLADDLPGAIKAVWNSAFAPEAPWSSLC